MKGAPTAKTVTKENFRGVTERLRQLKVEAKREVWGKGNRISKVSSKKQKVACLRPVSSQLVTGLV